MDELGGDIMNRRRMMMNDKIVSAQGENFVINNVKSSKLNGLNIYGKSKQDGTPSPENPVPIVSAGDEGEINVTVQGGNLVDIPDIPAGDGGLNVTIPVDISETFTVSVDDSDVIVIYNVWRLRFDFEDGTLCYAIDGTFPVTVNVTPENKVVSIMYRDIRMESGAYRNFMLNAGSTPLPYMPYKTPQTLTAQTPGGLPGIPVESGGNYTDESGQQWICDEVDFKRGVYVQRVWKGTFDGSEDENWIVYGASDFDRRGFACLNVLLEETNRKDGLSNQFVVGGVGIAGEDIIWIGVNNKNIYALTQEWFDKGVDAWKAHLAAHPLEVMTYLETPIETDLSDEEIAAYKSLHTYTPNTTVSNDTDTILKIRYREYKN